MAGGEPPGASGGPWTCPARGAERGDGVVPGRDPSWTVGPRGRCAQSRLLLREAWHVLWPRTSSHSNKVVTAGKTQHVLERFISNGGG